MKNKILVTGHKGFLGKYLFKILKNNKNNYVIGKDINLYGNKRNYKNNFIKTTKKEFKNINIIVHLAGISTNYDPNKNIYKKLSFKANYFDTLKFANLAKENGVKKFIFASSTSVYGDKNNKVVSESSKLFPTTSYGKSKKKIEKRLIKISSPNFKVIILRMATLFGISERMRFDLLINNLVASYIVNKRIILLSDGTKIRPQIDLKDASIVYDFFIKNEINQNYIVLNVGRNDYNLKISQIARKLAKVFKCKIEYGKNDLDKRSYKVSFKKLNMYLSLKKNKNTIERSARAIKFKYRNKNKLYFNNEKFYNLSTIKRFIKSKEIRNLIK
jgi:nucleoside-diphosphate-sugar epimerase